MVSLQRPTNEQQQQPESSSLRPFLPRLHSVGEEEALVSGLCLCVGVCLYFCVYICNIILSYAHRPGIGQYMLYLIIHIWLEVMALVVSILYISD